MNPKKRIDELVRLVKYYDYSLHVKGTTLIADEIYDSMRKELETLEQMYPNLIRPDSPSLYIGQVDVSCNKIIERKEPMLSIRHTYDQKEILDFFSKYPDSVLELKLDGVALSIEYENNILDSISLRGDGYKGEDVTHFAPYIENLAYKINNYKNISNFTGTIRGEIIAPKDKIERNNRNYVAGALRKKNATFHHLKFYPYQVVHDDIKTQTDTFDFLKHSFDVPPFKLLNKDSDLLEEIKNIKSLSVDFFIDGVVLKMNDITFGKSLGITNRYPRNMIAFKTAEHQKTTEIIGINWSMRKSGVLNPIVLVKPIEIGGSNISKVNAFNKRYLEINNLGKASIITIARVGNVVPQIANIICSTTFETMTKCPFCKIEIYNDNINYVCTNIKCPEIIKEKILYFFKTLAIDGLAENILNPMIEKEGNLIQILKILKTKNWIGNKNDQKAFENLQKQFSIKEILIALGINGVSEVFINKLDIHKPQDLLNITLKDQKTSHNFKRFIEHHMNEISDIFHIINNLA